LFVVVHPDVNSGIKMRRRARTLSRMRGRFAKAAGVALLMAAAWPALVFAQAPQQDIQQQAQPQGGPPSQGEPSAPPPPQAATVADPVAIPGFWDPRRRPERPDLTRITLIRFLTETDYPPFNYAG